MDFPDFNEFLKTLKDSKNKLIVEKFQSLQEPSNLKELAKTVSEANMIYTLEVLKLYHQWLSKHFENH